METKRREKETVVTQVSFGGFDKDVTARDLVAYLDNEIGQVWRCRLKTSWTPPESYPNFEITDTAVIQRVDAYRRVEPHAFVHFASPDSATWAKNAAGHCELFFNGRPVKVSLGPENPFHLNQRRRTTIPFKLSDVHVEIGTLVSRDEFLVGWRGPPSGVDFLVDPFDGKCKFCFTRDTAFSFKGTTEHAVIRCDFKLEFLVRDINEIKQYTDTSCLVILLQLASAPSVWYRTADDDIEVLVPFDLLDDDDPWIRTTDFTPSGAIGRCNSYRVSIPPRHGAKLKRALNFLRERRVQEDCLRRPLHVTAEPEYEMPMSDPFFCIHHEEGVDFNLMFLVNAVMHKGIFNQHQLSDSFFDLLRNQPLDVNIAALRHICSYKHPVFDAHKRLKAVQQWLLKNPKLFRSSKQLDDIVEIRRLAITPTRAYCLPPEVELSNRVLRRYKDIADQFLRVTFMDEGLQTMNANTLTYYCAPIVRDITSNSFSQKTRIFKRVKSILTDGFYLCGRKYSFLAFSSNQLRDRSAWFFAEDGKTSVSKIRNWMGKFTNRNIAKCAARMGQCFSSTYATVEVPSAEAILDLPDIERNNYIFSDGIGMITPDLAKEVAEKLKLEVNPPCAYQIRYAGCKGVVACWPAHIDGIRLSLRVSMNKFHSNHTTLEICSWTRFQPGFLNRQIITLLSTLDVPDEIFWKMQIVMVSKLNQMFMDADVAFDVVTASCAEQGNTAAIMLSAGFNPKTEPHLCGMLTCIRAAQLWGLREKTRIFVPSGRWLMGCLDELGVLEHGQCFIQVSNPSLESCFWKHGSRFSESKKKLQVVKGTVVVAKNPCLHPGDIRILEAVDAPELHHLHDCLVFPQKGDRPHTNEASGSDLDGDLYFVTWDENLIPPSKRSWLPMQYDAAEAKQLNRPVNHQDIIDFFAKNMVNENLGAICNAHVVHADLSEYGALDENCIKLAELAATAVDFPKTGKLVTMPPHLKPKLYPDFMGKEDYQSYNSNKILGRLYRQVKDDYNDDDDDDDDAATSSELNLVRGDIPYDKDLEVSGSSDYILDAWDQKCSYDGQLKGLLAQYKVKREEEVVTGHIWSMPKCNSRKQGELKERLKQSYHSLKKEFRQVFEKMDSDFEQLTEDEKNLLYEQKASAWYQVAYHPKWVNKSMELQEPDAAGCASMLSFAWIAADYLARIKIRCRGFDGVDTSKPVNSLVKYLADRI
ncbi:RNA-dependent RNA polymerase 6 [Ricinus communis]|uniref:RNA-dependent RNA polymerase n=1 Tax=Ricinus communis TaxID=3988 RepID=B9RP51_RICCO|nr:RNA-dependent RNA polymerase 6 [Ricinus communis]XP_048227744.1 RNA-dependent RNA polymerase 6 [Ricinus communis]EEF46969.1 RNA-dependent RNA polymerase, putative [Ricinus communis]|eukprot:XP_002515520.1 RNA-dependent RNA polymerase 6 [Ricinus communis]